MSIVLVTGSAGLIGSETVKFYAGMGFDVVGIDNNFRQFFLVMMHLLNGIEQNLKSSFLAIGTMMLTLGIRKVSIKFLKKLARISYSLFTQQRNRLTIGLPMILSWI